MLVFATSRAKYKQQQQQKIIKNTNKHPFKINKLSANKKTQNNYFLIH